VSASQSDPPKDLDASQPEPGYSSSGTQYEGEKKCREEISRPSVRTGKETHKPPPPIQTPSSLEPQPAIPQLSGQEADPIGSSNWGAFISSWAWQVGSRVQAKALGGVDLNGLQFI
jgi:hypothetical protein